MSHKIFNNDLVAIHKSKVILTLNKSAYNGMCILDLNKVLMQKFHCDYIKNKNGNNSRLLFTDTDSLMHEIKTNNACLLKILTKIKQFLILVIIQLSQNIMMTQRNQWLVKWKMKQGVSLLKTFLV